MKTCPFTIILIAGALALSSACSKQDQTQTSTTPETPPSASTTSEVNPTAEALKEQAAELRESADRTAAQVQEQASAAKETIQNVTADLKDQAVALKDSVKDAAADTQVTISSKSQEILDNAKKLLSENNWSEALKSLGELANVKLTPEQQATLASLKEQAQKLAGTAATNVTQQAGRALGDLLKK